MNICFFDPISERWIKPRPEREPEQPPCMSMGEALLAAVEAKAVQERNAKIWEYLKQSAEGCNDVSVSPSPSPAPDPVNLQWDGRPLADQIAEVYGIPIVTSEPAEYEAVESLGYVYWRKKETA